VSLSFLNVRRIGTLQERRRFGSLPFGNPGSAPLAELLIDRGYLGSPRIGDLHAHGWRFGPRRGRVPTGAGSRSRRLRFGWLRPASSVPRTKRRGSFPEPRRCTSPRPSAKPLPSPRGVHHPPAAEGARSRFTRRKRSLSAHQQQPQGAGPLPSAHDGRTLAREWITFKDRKRALQGDSQEYARCPTCRRHCQSPTDCQARPRRVNFMCSAL
jgi:hypothetical protein